MDEIGQEPKPTVGFPRGRWLDIAVAVALIAAVAITVMTGRGSRPAAAPAGRPGTAAAPALLPSTVRTRIPLPSGRGGMTILGSTAWISDWSASQIVGVDLAAGRVTRTVRVGDQQDNPVSMTSGAGSLWVLDFSGLLLRIDPATGVITKRFPVRGLGADVAYGDGFIWMITDEPAAGGQMITDEPAQQPRVPVQDRPVPRRDREGGPDPGCGTGMYRVPRAARHLDRLRRRRPHHLDQPGLAQAGTDPAGRQRRIHPADRPRPRRRVGAHPFRASAGGPGHRPDHRHHPRRPRPSAMSAPALIMDTVGRLWITGSLLAIVMPGTLTSYPVAHTPNLISAAADGPAIWVDTGSTLVRLQVDTP